MKVPTIPDEVIAKVTNREERSAAKSLNAGLADAERFTELQPYLMAHAQRVFSDTRLPEEFRGPGMLSAYLAGMSLFFRCLEEMEIH